MAFKQKTVFPPPLTQPPAYSFSLSLNVHQPPCSSPPRSSFSSKCEEGPRQASSLRPVFRGSWYPQYHHKACQGYKTTTRTTIWHQASCNFGEAPHIFLPSSSPTYHMLTESTVQCARSRSWSLIPPSSTVQRGSSSPFCPTLPFTDRHRSCRRRDSVIPTTNLYLNLATPTKMLPSAYSDDMDDPSGSKIPTYVAAMKPTPRPTSDARIPPLAQ